MIMRIDAYNKIGQMYQVNTKKPVNKQSKAQKSDKIEISDFGQSLAIAKQAVHDAPDVRMDRVMELKEQISSGKYQVSNEEIADKLLGQYFSTSV